MKRQIKYVLGIIVFITFMIIFSDKVDASSASISTSVSDKTVTVNISVNETAAWNLKVTSNMNLISGETAFAAASSDAKNTSKVVATLKYQAPEYGTYNVSLAGEITDENANKSTVSETKSVSVVSNNSSSEGSNNNNSSSGNNNSSSSSQETPKATYTEVNETVYATGSVNVRSSASTSASIIGSLSVGQEITRIGRGSNGWSRVKYNGQTAYVSSNYLTTEKMESNAYLSSLSIEGFEISPEFSKDVMSYFANVGIDVENIKINAIAENDSDTVTIAGNEGLKEGKNIVTINVKTEEGVENNYTIEVTKGENLEDKLGLKNITIEGYELTPNFSIDVYEYTINIGTDINKLNIETELNLEGSTVEIVGNEELEDGSIITIIVKSANGEETATYQIKIIKGENVVGKNLRSLSAQKQKEFLEALTKVYFVSAVVTTIFVIITIILLIFRYNTTKQEDEEYYNGYNNTDDDYKDNYLNQIYNENINNKQENNYNDLSSTEYDRDYNNNYSNDNIFKDNNDNQNDDDRPRRGKHF